VVKVDVGIVGDLRDTLLKLLPMLPEVRYEAWEKRIQDLKADTAMRDIKNVPGNGRLFTAHVIHDLWEATEGDAITVTDVGQHQMWAAQYYRYEDPHRLITSGGLGTMGFALPAAIGARFARPDEEVWVIVGDGGFQMNLPELATCVQEKIKINIALINNGYLGMVRQWQELFYERRYTATPLLNPDYMKLAEAYGVKGMRVDKRDQVWDAVQAARETEGTVLIDFRVEKEDMVYPMVPAGAALDAMIRRPEGALPTVKTSETSE
jgi:acetolactate synthase-1/2/3 large subunit